MAKEAASAVSARRGVKKAGVLGALFRGLLAAVAVTVLGVVVFALVIKWLSPNDTIISVMNQALKLLAVLAGTRAAVRGGGSGVGSLWPPGSLAFSLTFPSSVSEGERRCTRGCM